ncbi:MAG: AbrB/MazE/SpoVT family DNA-binding domain-containing protein [Bacteroidetes bacterium]|nr:AbrB/MazE/SpoVT family DNA-binding domain-containing protein [Bacteroidota bacterium]MCW5894528.1 AbrB/MazE/SpoVT family DNA-binding domain-containing protein [Bacteroidota bacterium]
METSVITTRGRMNIPQRIRQKLKLKRGVRVVIIEQEGGFFVKPLGQRYFESLAGILPVKGKATRALLEDRKIEQKREDT